ncbi:MAG: hypothetical protein V1817_01300 [Candidatus Micrarchaeota archaeon]
MKKISTKNFFVASAIPLFLACIAFTACFAAFCAAEAPPEPPSGSFALTLYAKTLNDSQPIAGRTVVYTLRDAYDGSKMLFSRTTAADGAAIVYVDAGKWFLHAEIDSSNARADYAAVMTLNVSRDANHTVYFQRVASASGSVTDEANESVADARVEVSCLQGFYELQALNAETSARFESANALRADASGSFLLKFVPVGMCRFTATVPSAGNESVSQLVEIKAGELAHVSLKIKRRPSAIASNLVWLALLALALILVAWFGREYLRKRGETRAKEAKPEKRSVPASATASATASAVEEKLKPTSKMRNVMNALNERERRIVEVLIASGGKLKQSKVYRETLIPKTSLARALESLEKRNVVRLTPEGNSQLVELTDWFTSR